MLSIANSLAGRTILVTGATGFLAKAFLAKVVRDLPDVARVVVLVRPKRRAGGLQVRAAERLEREVLGSSAFRRLRSELGDAFEETVRRKVVAVEGDLTLDGLGLSPEDAAIVSEVTAIVNSAATVVFDERLDVALAINTLGVRRLIDLARDRGGIPLLHVSTAYVCGRRQGLVLEEPPSLTRTAGDDIEGRAAGTLDLDAEVEALTEACRAIGREAATPEVARRLSREARNGDSAEARRRWVKDRLVDEGMSRARARGWNDTYTYTKSLGERVLLRERGTVPACIVRPSIIESSLREPEPGWIDGLRMADPLFAAYGKGALRRIPSDPDSFVDFIPVDHVVNAMLAALARLCSAPPAAGELPVHHVATSHANPLRFRELFDLTRGYFLAHPFLDDEGHPIVPASAVTTDDRSFQRSLAWRRLAVKWGLRALDALPRGAGRTHRATLSRGRAQIERIAYYVRIYGPYTSFPARFDTRRTDELRASLSRADREAFDFDARGFDWRTYIQDVHLPGLLRNVLREPAPGPIAHSSASAVPAEEGAVEGRTIPDLVAAAAREHGDRLALRVHRGRELTHRQLHEQSLGAAATLRGAGVQRGDRVVLQAENGPDWPIAYLAIVSAGATAVPLDHQLPGARVAEIATFVGARAIVASKRCAAELPAGTPPVLLASELAGHALDAGEAARAGLPVPISAEQAASILFTSGTTLEPKGVVLPHRAILANVESIREVLRPTADERLVSVLPLHHAFEFTAGMLSPISAGGSITYLETPSSAAIVEALHDTKATCLLGVPRLYELMLEGIRRQMAELSGGAAAALGALRGTSRAFSAVGLNAGKALLAPLHARFGGHVRAFVSGGAALDPKVHDEFKALGFTLVEGYGLTETAPVLTVNPIDATRAGSVGRPVPGVEIRIDRPGSDGVGEIVARGANLMSGYYRDPEATTRVLRDGWFSTGDLGRMDADGYLHVTGRLKDLIVTGAGKNVHPDEVEAQLGELPGVAERTVAGVRSRSGSGEEVHLVVVLAGPDTAEARKQVRDAVAARGEGVPAHQRISKVHFWEGELPKTRLMKVKRGEVRARLESAGRAQQAAPAGAPAAIAADPFGEEMLSLLSRLTRSPVSGLRLDQELAADLGVDSLMLVELVSTIEARTGRAVPEDAARDLATVRDLLDLARRQDQAGAGGEQPADAASPACLPRGGIIARTAAPIVRTTWPLFYGGFLRLETRGLENLPGTGPYIVAANHQSHLDAGAVLTAMGDEARRVHVVAASDYFFDTPWKGRFFTELLNAIPFDRHGDFEAGLDSCRKALRAGDPLLIFPEGTRSPDGRLQDFKAGIGVLALELGVPVIPTRIDGTHAALPKGAALPKRRRVRVAFGQPILARAIAPDDGALPYERYRTVVETVRARIVDLAPA